MSRYRLHERIGMGGMGDVYRATRITVRGDESTVACKVMRQRLLGDEQFREYFRREANIMLSISNNHPGLVSVYEWLRDREGQEYLIMEFVEGCTLEALNRLHGRLSFDVLRLVASDVLDILGYVHEHGILHRDISACNLLVSREGHVKVADFGLAKWMHDGKSERFCGKFLNASPEALKCQVLDGRADLFSVGTVLYEWIVGTPAYEEMAQLGARRVPTLPDDVPDDLRVLTLGLIEPSREGRCARTASEARGMLHPVADPGAARAELARMVGDVCAREQKKADARGKTGRLVDATAVMERSGAVSEETTSRRSPGEDIADKRTQRAGPRRRWTGLAAAAAVATLCLFLGERWLAGYAYDEPAAMSLILEERSDQPRTLSSAREANGATVTDEPGEGNGAPAPSIIGSTSRAVAKSARDGHVSIPAPEQGTRAEIARTSTQAAPPATPRGGCDDGGPCYVVGFPEP